jgi:hypothetical protein
MYMAYCTVQYFKILSSHHLPSDVDKNIGNFSVSRSGGRIKSMAMIFKCILCGQARKILRSDVNKINKLYCDID